VDINEDINSAVFSLINAKKNNYKIIDWHYEIENNNYIDNKTIRFDNKLLFLRNLFNATKRLLKYNKPKLE